MRTSTGLRSGNSAALESIRAELRPALLSSGAGVAARYPNYLLRGIEISGDGVRLATNTAALLSEDLHRAQVGTADHEG